MVDNHGGPVGRCRGLNADIPGSSLGEGNFFFFFWKELSFLALGFRCFGSRVSGLESIGQWSNKGGSGAYSPPSLVQSVHISCDYHGNKTMAREGAWDCVKVVTLVYICIYIYIYFFLYVCLVRHSVSAPPYSNSLDSFNFAQRHSIP